MVIRDCVVVAETDCDDVEVVVLVNVVLVEFDIAAKVNSADVAPVPSAFCDAET